MEPLDLRAHPPRGPREQLAGLMFLPRAIDKLRATLPGGDCGEYFPYKGLSELFAYITGIDLHELRDVIAHASSEAQVAAWVAQRVDEQRIGKSNHVMSGYTIEKIPPSHRELFESAARPDLRSRYPNLFDLLEADDAAAFQGVAEG